MTNNMFASIKDSLAKPTQSSSTTSNIMRLKTGNTYTIRLLPYTAEPSKTFFHYFSHGWVSEATGQFQSSISPQTWGERDPIAEARFRIMRTGSEEEKEKAKALTRREQWLINVYVVKDPENQVVISVLKLKSKEAIQATLHQGLLVHLKSQV